MPEIPADAPRSFSARRKLRTDVDWDVIEFVCSSIVEGSVGVKSNCSRGRKGSTSHRESLAASRVQGTSAKWTGTIAGDIDYRLACRWRRKPRFLPRVRKRGKENSALAKFTVIGGPFLAGREARERTDRIRLRGRTLPRRLIPDGLSGRLRLPSSRSSGKRRRVIGRAHACHRAKDFHGPGKTVDDTDRLPRILLMDSCDPFRRTGKVGRPSGFHRKPIGRFEEDSTYFSFNPQSDLSTHSFLRTEE